jgi:3-oxoacyl-[acyl-carrier-protein] synthase II
MCLLRNVMIKQVVVTGLGVVSGCGNTAQSFWDFLLSGCSSIARIQSFDVTDYKCQIGSEVAARLHIIA